MKYCYTRKINDAIKDSYDTNYSNMCEFDCIDANQRCYERNYCSRINVMGDDYGAMPGKFEPREIVDELVRANVYFEDETGMTLRETKVITTFRFIGSDNIEQERIGQKKFYIALGKRVTDIRKMLGLTVTELSIKSNVSRNTIYDIEHGYHSIKSHIIFKLAQALNVSVDYLMTGKPITVIDGRVETTYIDTTDY